MAHTPKPIRKRLKRTRSRRAHGLATFVLIDESHTLLFSPESQRQMREFLKLSRSPRHHDVHDAEVAASEDGRTIVPDEAHTMPPSTAAVEWVRKMGQESRLPHPILDPYSED